MDQIPQDQAPPIGAELRIRARAIAFYADAADIHIAAEVANRRGTSVRLGDVHQLDDGGLSVTTADGETTEVPAAQVAAKRLEWTTGEKLQDAIKFVTEQEADRRRVRLARRLGRDTAHVTEFSRDDAGIKRTRLKAITLAPRRPVAVRSTGRAARQATNHRSAGSRRGAASSSTSSSDPGDSDPEPPPAAPLRLAPAPRAVLVFGANAADDSAGAA